MIGNWFMRLAVLFAIVGMGLGIGMGIAHDFVLAPVHAHVNLVGWATMFLAGLFYRTVPEADGVVARVHFALAAPGAVVLSTGIAGSVLNIGWGVPVAIAGSLMTFAAMLAFAFAVWRWTMRSAADGFAGRAEPALRGG